MIIQNNCNSIVNKIESICPTNNNKNKSETSLQKKEKEKEKEKENNFKSMLDVEMKKLV